MALRGGVLLPVVLLAVWVLGEQLTSASRIIDLNKCNDNRPPPIQNATRMSPIREAIQLWQGVVLLLCIGAFSLFICLIHRVIRTYIYYDAHLLDTYFDGGGDVNASLVAVAVVSRWVWPFTFSQPVNDVREVGLVGHFWFAAGLVIHLFLFAIVAAEIRIKAPGAKTFLQVLYARFGAGTHVVVMVFALICNIMVVGMVMLEGTRIMVAVTQGLSNEVAAILLVVVVVFYTLVGGVGGSMYVAYFMTSLVLAVTLVMVSEVFWDPLGMRGVNDDLGSISALYRRLDCGMVSPMAGNDRGSPLTFVSRGGLVNGVLLILAGFSSVFMNQSFWQAGMAAKPGHAVWGFILAGLAYFAVPFAMALALGIGYWAISIRAGEHSLIDDHTLTGMAPMYVAQTLMGTTGTFLMLAVVLASTVSTASAQVLSTSSLIIYDIYQTYISPFKPSPVPEDKQMSVRMQRAIRNEEYLEYDRRSVWLKHVVVVAVTVLLIPITLVLLAARADAYWLFVVTGLTCGGCVAPVALSITWHRTTGAGVTAGALGGFVVGMITWLALASVQPGGLAMEHFRASTTAWVPLVVGLSLSLGLGCVMCVIVSVSCGGCDADLVEEEEWEKTRQIDNPILPWAVKYAPDIGATSLQAKGRPHFFTVRRTFKKSEVAAYIVGVLLAVCAVLVWPAAMLPADIFSMSMFSTWVYAALIWAAVATAFVTLVPAIWEVAQNCRQAYYNRRWAHGGAGAAHGRLHEEDASEVHPDTPYRHHPPTPAPDPGPAHLQPAHRHSAHVLPSAHGLSSPSEPHEIDSEYYSNAPSEIHDNGSRRERWKTFIHLE